MRLHKLLLKATVRRLALQSRSRLDHVGHAACDWNNSQEGISMPIFGILCDKVSFEFFKYDGSLDTPTFSKGRLSAGSPEPLELADLGMNTSALPFLHSLRLVSEIIFDVLLMAYSSSLTAYRNRSMAKTAETGEPGKSLGGWEEAIEKANIARQMFRDGDTKRTAGQIQEANADSLEGMRHLTLRYYFSLISCLVTQACIPLSSTDAVPAIYRLPSLMDSWVDGDVERM